MTEPSPTAVSRQTEVADFVVVKPTPHYCWISRQDIDDLIEDVDSIETPGDFSPVVLFFAGVALTGLLNLLQLAVISDGIPPLVWNISTAIFSAGVVGVLISWWYSRGMGSSQEKAQNRVLRVLRRLASSFENSSEESVVDGPGCRGPISGTLDPASGTLPSNQKVRLEFSGRHTDSVDSIRWVRLILGPSVKYQQNWPRQLYMSINPSGRLNLWDSAGRSHTAQLPATGVLETDTATIYLDETHLELATHEIRLQMSIAIKVTGQVNAYLTTSAQETLAASGYVKVGQFSIE